MENSCKDCKYYLPVDVFQGMCKMDKTSIGPDHESCVKFDRLPKCKFCRKFKAEKEYLGTCLGNTIAYPDMNASKCAGFEWYRQN